MPINWLRRDGDVAGSIEKNTIDSEHLSLVKFTDSDLGQHAINGMPMLLVRVTLVKHLIDGVHAPNRIMILKEANKSTLTGK